MVSKMPDLHQNLRRKKCKKRKLGKGSKKNDSPRKKRKKRKLGSKKNDSPRKKRQKCKKRKFGKV